MLEQFRIRAVLKTQAVGWAEQAVRIYGRDAERVIRACLEHPGYRGLERYGLKRVLAEVRRERRRGQPPVFRFGNVEARRSVD